MKKIREYLILGLLFLPLILFSEYITLNPQFVQYIGTEEVQSEVQFIDSYQTNINDLALVTQGGKNQTGVIYMSSTFSTSGYSVLGSFFISQSINTYVHTNSVSLANRRFYKVGINNNDINYTNESVWAMYKQARVANQRYLVSLPINYALLNTTGIQQKAGQQLLSGLVPYWDFIRYSPTNLLYNQFVTNTIRTNANGTAYWYDPNTDAPSTLNLYPSIALYINCATNISSTRTNAVFTGPIYTTNNVPYVEFKTNGIGFPANSYTYFGWQLPDNGRNINLGIGLTPSNQLGFLKAGALGGTSRITIDIPQLGDQIWVWSNNTWRSYWLYDFGVGGNSSNFNGRWLDTADNLADFSLEPGLGYLYFHTTNRNANNFYWRPTYYTNY